MALKLFKKPIWQQDKVVDSHPLQKQVFEDTSRHKIIVAGRRFGKTILLSEECLKIAKQIPNANCWIVSTSKGKTKSTYWDYLTGRAKWLGWVTRNEQMRRSDSTIILNNHSTITLKSYENPSSLVGEGLDFLGLDEFNSEYVDHMDSIFEVQLYPTIIDRKGRIFVISTPNGFDKLYDLYMMGQNDSNNERYDSDFKSWLFKTIDNPFIDKKEIEKARKKLSPQAFRQEFEASFESSSNGAYKVFNRAIHLKELELDRNLPLCLSFDFNTAFMTTTVSQIRDGNEKIGEQFKVIDVYRSIVTENTSTQGHCDEIKFWLKQIDWQGEIYIYGDATGGCRSVQSDDLSHNWNKIQNNFPTACLNIPRKNPDQRNRVESVVTKLMNGANQVGIFINKNGCLPLIQDFEQARWKGNVIDKSDEDIGRIHNSENFGYLVYQEFPDVKSTPVQFAFA